MILPLVDDSLPYPAFALPRLAFARSATLFLRPRFRWLGTRLAVGENFSTGHGRFFHLHFLYEAALSDTNTVTNSRYDGIGSTPPYFTSLRLDPLAWYCLYSTPASTLLHSTTKGLTTAHSCFPLRGWYCTASFLCLGSAISWAIEPLRRIFRARL